MGIGVLRNLHTILITQLDHWPANNAHIVIIFTLSVHPEVQKKAQWEQFSLILLQRIPEPTREVVLFDHIQHFAYGWPSTFDFIPPRIFPSVINRHRETDENAQGGKADIQCDTLDVSRSFVVREAKGSQDGEALTDGVEHA